MKREGVLVGLFAKGEGLSFGNETGGNLAFGAGGKSVVGFNPAGGADRESGG